MNYYNSETLLEQQAEIEKLKEQNAALAAQVIILTRKIFATYHNQINVSVDNKLGVMDVFEDVGELFELAKTTPQQHLAEIRAEAVDGAADWLAKKYPHLANPSCGLITHYAEQIRKDEVK